MEDLSAEDRGLIIARDNFEVFSANFLKVKAKSGKIVPFVWNRAQQYLHARIEKQRQELGYVRALCLKGRQQGASTYIGARFYHRTSMNFGQSAFIMAHEDKATSNLFEMVKRYHDHNDLAPSTKASNAQELVFGVLDGGYKLATAGSKDVGRSNTVRLLHGCLSLDTLVVDGITGALRRMDSFEIGDMVRTHTGAVAPISVISQQEKPARSVSMRTFGLPFTATDEHRFWTPGGWRELRDIGVGDEIGFPIHEISEQKTVVQFAQPACPRPQGGGSVERVPDVVELNYDVGRILGLYLAEGTVSRQSKSGTPSCTTFAVHELEVDRTIHWLGILAGLITSINVRYVKGSKTAVVSAYGKSFASFVSLMCGNVDNKHLPRKWQTSGREFSRGLLHGYLCGDGHFSPARDRRISATSIRSAITIGMRDVMASLGYGWASIEHKVAAVRHGRSEKEAFTLRLSGPGVVQLSREVGKPFFDYQRQAGGGNFGARVEGGYAWIKVASISDPVLQDVMDFEVDHQDHSYCLPNGASHNSEVGFWANAEGHMAGIGNTVPSGAEAEGTEIILESTANGIGGSFHKMWQAAESGVDEDGNPSEYIAIFIPWFWQDEYRTPVRDGFVLSAEAQKVMDAYGLDMEQMQWRADKIASYGKGMGWLFKQEYPCTAAEAFQTSTLNPLISPEDVSLAVNNRGWSEMQGPFIIGCDPAEEGFDRTAIVFRTGRTVWRCEYHEKKRTMQVAGILADMWIKGVEFRGQRVFPDAIFIDRIGIGAGIVDRLHELNIPVIGVHSGERANESDIYENKRAEMWWNMKEWIEDHPNRLPNDAALISDLIAPQPAVTSKSKRLLESKKDMKKRGIRSPDGGDALALTFAEPVLPRVHTQYEGQGGYRAPTKAGY